MGREGNLNGRLRRSRKSLLPVCIRHRPFTAGTWTERLIIKESNRSSAGEIFAHSQCFSREKVSAEMEKVAS
jgi:hypothetical protein